VLLHVLLGHGHELAGHQLESPVLEPLDDLPNESPLDAVWLDGDESLLRGDISGGGGHGGCACC